MNDDFTEPDHITLGRYIRENRERRGMSLRGLAKAIDNDPKYLSRIERDHYKRPNANVLHRIADVLDLSYADLLLLTGQEPPEDLPSLAVYLSRKYGLDDATAGKLARQFKQILSEQPPGRRVSEDTT
ncbi:MAG: helix-turn-helix domain-containing protein [Mycobacteriales bacterium]